MAANDKLRERLIAEGAPKVCLNILTRMDEIDPTDTPPDGDTYNELWDAVLDELAAWKE